MSLYTVKMLGINITNSSKETILKEIQKRLDSSGSNRAKSGQNQGKTMVIVTPNPEQVMRARRDSHFAQLINQADIAIPDGVGLVWAHQQLAKNSAEKLTKPIPGVECMENLVFTAAEKRVPIVLIGGSGGLAVRALDCLRKKHPNLTGWATDAPMMSINGGQLVFPGKEEFLRRLSDRILATGAGFVFVGLGAPKQEYFIEQLQSILGKSKLQKTIILMSVGGSFDEISGRLPKPPEWVSAAGLKWLWRLILEPWRIKRQLALASFVFLVLRERFNLI